VASGRPRVTEPVQTTSFVTDPDTSRLDGPTIGYSATVTSKNLDDGAAPLFQSPTHIDGLSESDNWVWSRQDGALLGGRIHRGESYTETVLEPQPSLTTLQQSKSLANTPGLQHWLQRPTGLPPSVATLVTSLTAKQPVRTRGQWPS